MNEAEYLMKNYGDRGTPSEISIILHDTETEFNNCFIIYSK